MLGRRLIVRDQPPLGARSIRTLLRERWRNAMSVREPEVYSDGSYSRSTWDDASRDSSFTAKRWRMHRDRFRHVRHIFLWWRSATLQRILVPDLLCVGGLGTGLCWWNSHDGLADPVMFPIEPFRLVTVALGLLLVFRTQSASTRFNDAREVWSRTVTECRTLSRYIMQHMEPVDEVGAERVYNMVRAYPRALAFYVADGNAIGILSGPTDCADAQLRSMLEPLLTPEDMEAIICKKQRPHWLLYQLAMQVKVPQHLEARVDTAITNLDAALSSAERILRTPVPTTYTRHTSRFLFTFSMCLPFCLYASCGPLGTVPASLFLAYVLIGIEDISVTLEQPFDQLPLTAFVDQVDSIVRMCYNMPDPNADS